MDKEQHIEYWLNSAAHDLDVAEALLQNKKYDCCLFIRHLVIEKVLKAFYVKKWNEHPPKIHNLPRLAEKTDLSLSKEKKQFLILDFGHFGVSLKHEKSIG